MAIKRAVTKVKRIKDKNFTLDESYQRFDASTQLPMIASRKHPDTCEPLTFAGQNMHNPCGGKKRHYK